MSGELKCLVAMLQVVYDENHLHHTIWLHQQRLNFKLD